MVHAQNKWPFYTVASELSWFYHQALVAIAGFGLDSSSSIHSNLYTLKKRLHNIDTCNTIHGTDYGMPSKCLPLIRCQPDNML